MRLFETQEVEEFAKTYSERYEEKSTLGDGGMGSVAAATDYVIRREVAIKKLRKEYKDTFEGRKLFLREAQITGQLEHPNIIPVYDLGRDEDTGELFYTMKKIDGTSLEDILESIKEGKRAYITRYPLTVLLRIFEKVLDAVDFAHAKGVIHLDLKPENIMVGEFGEVWVLDWGIARLSKKRNEAMQSVSIESTLLDKEEDPKHANQVLGTPAFMAPEQVTGSLQQIGTRTDIYALGGILYNILTLRSPGIGRSTTVILKKVVAGNIRDPRAYNLQSDSEKEDAVYLAHCPNGKIPSSLSAISMKALQPKLEDRYLSVEDMQTDIDAYFSGFVTSAEQGSIMKHVQMFVKRYKISVGLVATALLINLSLLYALSPDEPVEEPQRELAPSVNIFKVNTVKALEQELSQKANDWKWTEYQTLIDFSKNLSLQDQTTLTKHQITRLLGDGNIQQSLKLLNQHDSSAPNALLNVSNLSIDEGLSEQEEIIWIKALIDSNYENAAYLYLVNEYGDSSVKLKKNIIQLHLPSFNKINKLNISFKGVNVTGIQPPVSNKKLIKLLTYKF